MYTQLFSFLSFIITSIALIAYINQRTLKIPTSSAVMIGALFLSLLFIIFSRQLVHVKYTVALQSKILHFDFHEFLVQIILSFLLFAGSLNIHIEHLFKVKSEVAILATLSTICSTLLISIALYYIAPIFGHHIPYGYTLLFGALISPTDPIAVLSLFKNLNADKRLSVLVAGESLFNDGVGIVLFITFYKFATIGNAPDFSEMLELFSIQFFGGILLGLGLGYACEKFLLSIDSIKVELLITLATVMGGYTLAQKIGVSGPLAMVAAGIFVGRKQQEHQSNIYYIWEMIDEVLNALLFSLIGIELIAISHDKWSLPLSVVAIAIVLLSRLLTVGVPMLLFKRFKKYPKNVIRILTWGGLRGGLAVALALSIPKIEARSIILTLTYSVVAFSIIIQGLTIKYMLPNK